MEVGQSARDLQSVTMCEFIDHYIVTVILEYCNDKTVIYNVLGLFT